MKTKNKKLRKLLSINSTNRIKYSVPLVNLSNNHLTEKELVQLSFGLEHSFVDKNKHIKKKLAANLEVDTEKVTDSLDKEVWEDYHEFLRAHTDIDDTYHNLKRIISDKTLPVVPGDKDSCVIIKKKADFIAKMQTMIDDDITCGDYTPATDNTLKDRKTFHEFLYQNFKDHPKYEKILLTSNQSARLYGIAKTHKFASPDIAATEKFKFWPIIAQTGTYTYNGAQVIAEYLKPLVDENPYIIRSMQDFPSILKAEPPLQIDEEHVSYDVESLFTIIPVKETINHILTEIYNHHKLKTMCGKLILKRLLLKLTTESTFIFNIKYYKETDSCTMGGPISVVFSDIYMIKLEKDAILLPRKPKLYKFFVGEIFTRRKNYCSWLVIRVP